MCEGFGFTSQLCRNRPETAALLLKQASVCLQTPEDLCCALRTRALIATHTPVLFHVASTAPGTSTTGPSCGEELRRSSISAVCRRKGAAGQLQSLYTGRLQVLPAKEPWPPELKSYRASLSVLVDLPICEMRPCCMPVIFRLPSGARKK